MCVCVREREREREREGEREREDSPEERYLKESRLACLEEEEEEASLRPEASVCLLAMVKCLVLNNDSIMAPHRWQGRRRKKERFSFIHSFTFHILLLLSIFPSFLFSIVIDEHPRQGVTCE